MPLPALRFKLFRQFPETARMGVATGDRFATRDRVREFEAHGLALTALQPGLLRQLGGSLLFVPREFQQADQLVNVGVFQPPQCLDCLVFHGSVEFSH